MLADVVDDVVEHHLRRVQPIQIERHVGHRVRLHLHVRLDAFLHLDATTRRQIVARRRQLQVGIVGQVHIGNLYQSLAVCARTYYYTTLQVLQRSARNLRGRRRLLVHQHHDGYHGVDGLQARLVFRLDTLQLTLRLDYALTLGQPHAQDVHTLRQRAATIAAQVQHQLLSTLLLQV